MENIRIGVLGAADVAVRRILPAMRRVAGIEFVAVASRTLSRAEDIAAAFGGEAARSYDALLDRDDVHAVYLPLPPSLHARWIERALRKGKHVLAEKPLTTSARDTISMVALAKEKGLVLAENYMFVHHRQHARVREMLDADVVGDVHSFTAAFAIPRRVPSDIRYQRALGGGALLDTAGYPVRAALWFLGSRLRVVGAHLCQDTELGVDVGGAALLAAGEVSTQLSFGLSHSYRSTYDFHGSKGLLSLEHVFTTPAQRKPVVRLTVDGVVEERPLPDDDQVANALAAFADAVRTGSPLPNDITMAQAELIDRIRDVAGTHGGSGHVK
jgi:predicted dehydrogenase